MVPISRVIAINTKNKIKQINRCFEKKTRFSSQYIQRATYGLKFYYAIHVDENYSKKVDVFAASINEYWQQ